MKKEYSFKQRCAMKNSTQNPMLKNELWKTVEGNAALTS